MTVNGFSTGSHQYTCAFANGGDETFTHGETTSPETWDGGETCLMKNPATPYGSNLKA
jgi:hypothetical protein